MTRANVAHAGRTRCLAIALAWASIAAPPTRLLPFPSVPADFELLRFSLFCCVAAVCAAASIFRVREAGGIVWSPLALLIVLRLGIALASGGAERESAAWAADVVRETGLLLVFAWVLQGDLDARSWSRHWLVAAGAVLFASLAEIFLRENPFVRGAPFLAGLLGNRNLVSIHLVQAVPLALLLAQQGGSRPARALALAFCTAGIFVALVLRTRSAWIALALYAGILIAGWSRDRSRSHLRGVAAYAACLGVALGAAAALPTQLRYRSASPWRDSLTGMFGFETSHGRDVLWRVALDMLLDRPLSGVGAGNYGASFQRYLSVSQVPPERFPPRPEFHAHDDYLHEGAEAGVPGLAAALALVAFLPGWLLWRALHMRAPPHELLLVAVPAGSAVIALVDGALRALPTSTAFFVALALALRARDARWLPLAGLRRAAVGAILAVAAAAPLAFGGAGLLALAQLQAFVSTRELARLEAASRHVPASLPIRTWLVHESLERGQVTSALRQAARLARVQPLAWRAAVLRARSGLASGDPARASRWLRRAVASVSAADRAAELADATPGVVK